MRYSHFHELLQRVGNERSSRVLMETLPGADLLVIAPMSANLLGHIANGLCDSLLTNLVRAWEIDSPADKRIIVAPAMNTYMWTHPLTARQLDVLRHEWSWFDVLGPKEKLLACNDIGQGGMVEWTVIVEIIQEKLPLVA